MYASFPKEILIPEEQFAAICGAVQSALARVFDTQARPTVLYHYTDSLGLHGIIESGVLRATHIGFMNDAKEYLHAVDLLREQIETAKSEVLDPLQKQLLDCMTDRLVGIQPFNFPPFFIACFSAAEDSLNQWRAYARGEGGFAIGVDPTQIWAKLSGTTAGLFPVVYDRDQQAGIIGDFLAWALADYPQRAMQLPAQQQPSHCENWVNMLFAVATQIAPLLKASSFEEECEWRIVWLAQSTHEVRFQPKQTMLSAYCEIPLGTPQQYPSDWPENHPGRKRPLPDKLPIQKIWMGPGRFNALSHVAVYAMLQSYGYIGVDLHRSPLSFRVAY